MIMGGMGTRTALMVENCTEHKIPGNVQRHCLYTEKILHQVVGGRGGVGVGSWGGREDISISELNESPTQHN